jgi:hypothetical protein
MIERLLSRTFSHFNEFIDSVEYDRLGESAEVNTAMMEADGGSNEPMPATLRCWRNRGRYYLMPSTGWRDII